MQCEGGDDTEDGLDDKEGADGKRKRPHGGCGYKQPVIRKEGLKLYAQMRGGNGEVGLVMPQEFLRFLQVHAAVGWRRGTDTAYS